MILFFFFFSFYLRTNIEMNKGSKSNPEMESLFFWEGREGGRGGGALEEQEDNFMPRYIVGHSVFVTSYD